MAYGFVTTIDRAGADIRILITETDLTPGDEAEITTMPSWGTVLRQTCVLTGGTGTTVDPSLTTSAGGTGIAVVVTNDVASSVVDNATPPVPWQGGTGSLFHQSNVDAGISTCTTVYLIQAGV